MIDRFERVITVEGDDLTDDDRRKLLADRRQVPGPPHARVGQRDRHPPRLTSQLPTPPDSVIRCFGRSCGQVRIAMSRLGPDPTLRSTCESLAGGVQLGAHDHGDPDQAEPGDQPEDRVDRRHRLVVRVGQPLHDHRSEVLEHREDDAGEHRSRPHVAPRRGVGREEAVHRGDHEDVDHHGCSDQRDVADRREAGGVDDAGDDERADLRQCDDRESEQCLAALNGQAVAVVDVDFPRVVEGTLEPDECLRRRPQRTPEPDDAARSGCR